MKQTIEIEIPDGKKAVWKDNKIIFEDIKPPLPKTWDEFCEQNLIKKGEYFLNSFSTSEPVTCETIRHKDSDRNILPSELAAEQHLALMQLHQLRDCYRQGWTPDWENKSIMYTIKNCYKVITKIIEPMIVNERNRCAFLSFPTYEMAEEFLDNFTDLIEQAGDLI